MLEPGISEQITPLVRRLVAPNPGLMTGPGTNTYLLGHDEVVLVDPGPALPAHIDAILAAGKGRISTIICTHTHPDHSPAWQAVAAATGARVYGALPANDSHQDETFAPDVVLTHEFRLQTPELSLLAIHTPGHVSNHYCFLLESEGVLFAGDHIMQGSTVVIIPPGGDMAAYIDSLQRLLHYPIACVAPGHGAVIEDSEREIARLVRHRQLRESKVLAGLKKLGRCDLDELVQVVYDDVDPSLHAWAQLSMTAHLIKLAAERRAAGSSDGRVWESVVGVAESGS